MGGWDVRVWLGHGNRHQVETVTVLFALKAGGPSASRSPGAGCFCVCERDVLYIYIHMHIHIQYMSNLLIPYPHAEFHIYMHNRCICTYTYRLYHVLICARCPGTCFRFLVCSSCVLLLASSGLACDFSGFFRDHKSVHIRSWSYLPKADRPFDCFVSSF